jgi:hypothetical protein
MIPGSAAANNSPFVSLARDAVGDMFLGLKIFGAIDKDIQREAGTFEEPLDGYLDFPGMFSIVTHDEKVNVALLRGLRSRPGTEENYLQWVNRLANLIHNAGDQFVHSRLYATLSCNVQAHFLHYVSCLIIAQIFSEITWLE